MARSKKTGIASRNSCTDFTLTSPALRTLPFDSSSALVEARGTKKSLREKPRCRLLSLFDSDRETQAFMKDK